MITQIFLQITLKNRGQFVGTSENIGHAITYNLLTNDTFKISHRSNVRHEDDPSSANLKSDPLTVPNVVNPYKINI